MTAVEAQDSNLHLSRTLYLEFKLGHHNAARFIRLHQASSGFIKELAQGTLPRPGRYHGLLKKRWSHLLEDIGGRGRVGLDVIVEVLEKLLRHRRGQVDLDAGRGGERCVPVGVLRWACCGGRGVARWA